MQKLSFLPALQLTGNSPPLVITDVDFSVLFEQSPSNGTRHIFSSTGESELFLR